ncbi:MAG: LAGLIDADG family homing endonuclease [bacterium]|nr:LAGLIDADG family homing endonuclease [bacterium]
MAYVVGFFAADGYITVTKRGGQFWSIQITDKELLYSIKRVIGSEHTIGERIGNENEKTLYRLQVGSNEMCADLRRLGFFEQKTKSMSVPNVPREYFSDFTRGYFDGDGNVWAGLLHKDRKTPTITLLMAFTSCSVRFLEHLKSRLCVFGLKGGSIYKSKRNYARLQYSSKDSLKLCDFMYNHKDFQKSGLFLERKKRVFEKYKNLKNAPVV